MNIGKKIMFNYNYICKCTNAGLKTTYTTKDYDYEQFVDVFKYVHCNSCSTIRIENGAIPDNLSLIYPNTYGAHQEDNFGWLGGKARIFAAYFKKRRISKFIAKDSKIIEFGCGSKPLISNFNHNPDLIFLVDHKLNKEKLSQFNLIEDDALAAITKIEDKFDIVVFNQLIEHIAEPEEFIRQCNRILKPGGILYLETPNFDGWDARFTLGTGLWGGFHAPRHLVIFNDLSLNKLLEKNNFIKLSFGSIFNPYMLNQTARAICLSKYKHKYSKLFNLSNPIVLCFFIFLDLIAIYIFGRKTSNYYYLFKK